MTPADVVAASAGEQTLFWVCASLAVLGAIGMVASRKAVHSALFVAMTMINLAILYVALQAPVLGMIQIIVYTGAVMMLFLFVLMIVGVDASDSLVETIKGQRPAAILFALGFGALLIATVGPSLAGRETGSLLLANTEAGGNVQGLANLIFGRYVLAFEVTSALLITAALGAIVLAHRERPFAKKSQAELATERFSSGEHPGPLPPPGTYARHNAVDTPALLPDGTTAENSVPGPYRVRGEVREINPNDVSEVVALAGGESVVVANLGPDADEATLPDPAADDAPADRGEDHGTSDHGGGEAR